MVNSLFEEQEKGWTRLPLTRPPAGSALFARGSRNAEVGNPPRRCVRSRRDSPSPPGNPGTRPGGQGSGLPGSRPCRATAIPVRPMPRNRVGAQMRRRDKLQPDGPPLVDLLRTARSEEAWEAFSRGSAIRRAGFARNVRVAMGNWLAGEDEPPSEAVSVLIEALRDPEPLVRGRAAWALGGVGSPEALQALERLLESGEQASAHEVRPNEWPRGRSTC